MTRHAERRAPRLAAGVALLQPAVAGGTLPALHPGRRLHGPAHRPLNIPGRCGVEISVETMARLSEHPRIAR